MAAMSAVVPVCLRASAPPATKSRAGRTSSRVAAPAALRTSAVTGRRAQGMSVRLLTPIYLPELLARESAPRKVLDSRFTATDRASGRVVIGAGYEGAHSS